MRLDRGADTKRLPRRRSSTLGIPLEDVHVISNQDTDLTPFGTGAYASRQTYVGGFSIQQTALLLKEKILGYAHEMTRMPAGILDIVDGMIVRKSDGRELLSMEELALEAFYSLSHSQHITAESTYQIKSNAYSFGCTVAEVEVDIEACKVKLVDAVNVHDCGRLINPALAKAQVHGGMSMGIGCGGPSECSEVRSRDPGRRCRNRRNAGAGYQMSAVITMDRTGTGWQTFAEKL
ncbi:MAG: molybdopterin cofactor-binding domain-containing protein [[Clostridium] scindens]